MTLFPKTFGPRPRDDCAALTTARLDGGVLPNPPGFTEPSPPGRIMHVGGLDVFVRHSPGPADVTPTWFIHGLEGSSRNWDRLAAVLAGHSAGYAPDLPGSGRSAPPTRGTYSIPTEVRLVAWLIEHQSSRPVHLVGNSRGGIVATLLAAAFPEMIRTLTLISPAVPDFRIFGERGADPRLAFVMVPGVRDSVSKRLDAITPADRAHGLAYNCFGEPEALTATDLAAVANEYVVRREMPWAAESTVQSLRSLIRAQARFGPWSFNAAAHAVAVPTLIVWGTRDRMVDCRLAERTAGAFSDSRLLMLARTGHVAQIERPVEVARAMVALWNDETAHAARTGAPCSSRAKIVGT
ncbi:MAG: alpha/beta hydrolase [Nakamurella sp.]